MPPSCVDAPDSASRSGSRHRPPPTSSEEAGHLRSSDPSRHGIARRSRATEKPRAAQAGSSARPLGVDEATETVASLRPGRVVAGPGFTIPETERGAQHIASRSTSRHLSNTCLLFLCASVTVLLGGCGAGGTTRSESNPPWRALETSGKAWSTPVQIDSPGDDPQGDIAALSCVSSEFCLAADNAGNVIFDREHTWSAPSRITLGGITGMSCASATLCAAAVAGGVVTYNGAKWTAHSVTGDNGAGSVQCGPPSSCVLIVPSARRAFAYDGGAWGELHSQLGKIFEHHVMSLVCTSATFCLAILGKAEDSTVAIFSKCEATACQ